MAPATRARTTPAAVWWVGNGDHGSAVTAWDFLRAHPEVTWEEIYAREEQWSCDADPFHGIFRQAFRPLSRSGAHNKPVTVRARVRDENLDQDLIGSVEPESRRCPAVVHRPRQAAPEEGLRGEGRTCIRWSTVAVGAVPGRR